MRKIFLLVFCLFAFSLPASATPPTSISLSYDLAQGTLHVEAIHPTSNLDKNFVRLMKVSVNDQEVSSLNYYKQNDYDKFSDDVPLTAQVGDVIKVELFCAEGGSMSKEMTVKTPGEAPSN